MDDLILIGLPASGKTTVGRQLAQRLDMPFVDCDEAIEAAAGCSVSDIFARYGESYFRQLEHRTLETLCRKESCVIATGGGAVLREDNRLLLQRSGTVFWLDRPLSDIMSTDFQTGRPLLTAGRKALERLAAERRALYAACAHYRIAEPLLELAISQIEEIWKGARP
ncbi:MAG: shikimate kinase [Oscillospiraceae bacterium]